MLIFNLLPLVGMAILVGATPPYQNFARCLLFKALLVDTLRTDQEANIVYASSSW